MVDMLKKCTMNLGLDLRPIECHSYLQSNNDHPSGFWGSACCAVSIPDTSKCTWHAVLPMNGWIHTLNIAAGARLCYVYTTVTLWWVGAYAFTHCMKFVTGFPVIASSCSWTAQTKRCVALATLPPPSLPPFSDTNISPPWAIDTVLIH